MSQRYSYPYIKPRTRAQAHFQSTSEQLAAAALVELQSSPSRETYSISTRSTHYGPSGYLLEPSVQQERRTNKRKSEPLPQIARKRQHIFVHQAVPPPQLQPTNYTSTQCRTPFTIAESEITWRHKQAPTPQSIRLPPISHGQQYYYQYPGALPSIDTIERDNRKFGN
mmetsp:Transcript_28682/g.31850  ORF Transcript_28682/g.31850 Transcript_28682/m.31850 type:complete len:168 (+) Transcript_28682:70-573(+)